jgi:hypothetical protein
VLLHRWIILSNLLPLRTHFLKQTLASLSRTILRNCASRPPRNRMTPKYTFILSSLLMFAHLFPMFMNRFDCGVFVMMFMTQWDGKIMKPFDQVCTNYFLRTNMFSIPICSVSSESFPTAW